MSSSPGLLVPLAIFVAVLAVRTLRDRKRERLAAQAALRTDDLLARLTPPADVHDAAAWDRYWDDQFSTPQLGGMQVMCAEMWCDLRELVAVMKARGMTSVLCVGHGASREPAALARAGLSVVALDLSSRAAAWCQRFDLDDDALHRFIDPAQVADGGRVEYCTGDLIDAGVCPGPFDVIIERRTVQLFGAAKGPALEALAARLRTPGILLSHCHDGRWRPPNPRTHANEAWFQSHGWTIWRGGPAPADFQGRVALLFMSTG